MEGCALSQKIHAAREKAAIDIDTKEHRLEQSGGLLLGHILKSLDDDNAENVVSIDLRGKSEMADHMVIASGRSTRQVNSISEKLVESLKHSLNWNTRVEGKERGDWVLIDAGDVIVHVFRPEVREFYQLEKLWMPSASELISR